MSTAGPFVRTIILAVALLVGDAAAAQDVPPATPPPAAPPLGARLRVTTASATLTGSLVRLTDDSLLLRGRDARALGVARADVIRLQISERARSRKKAVLIGLASGAVLGAVGGRAAVHGRECLPDLAGVIHCSDERGAGTAVGAIVGGLVGSGVGFAVGGRERWRPLGQGTSPVEVRPPK